MTKRKFLKFIFLTNIFILISSLLFFFYKILSNVAPEKFSIYTFDLSSLKHGVNEFENKKIAVIYQKNKFYILSTICTHLGCTVKWNERLNIFECPCHQSAFNIYGKVLRGPAKINLKQVKFIKKNNRLTVWLKNS